MLDMLYIIVIAPVNYTLNYADTYQTYLHNSIIIYILRINIYTYIIIKKIIITFFNKMNIRIIVRKKTVS